MAKENKIINIIKSRIQMAENGTLFFNNSFPEFDDEYVGQILSDLAKDGIIHHNTSRGVYLKTEETRFGLVSTVTARAAFSASRCAAFFATGYSAGIAADYPPEYPLIDKITITTASYPTKLLIQGISRDYYCKKFQF